MQRAYIFSNAHRPRCVTWLKSQVVMFSYYSRLLLYLSQCCTHCISSFKVRLRKIPRGGVSLNTVTHFKSSFHLTLACDALNYSLGAVLSHKSMLIGMRDQLLLFHVCRGLTTEARNVQLQKHSTLKTLSPFSRLTTENH